MPVTGRDHVAKMVANALVILVGGGGLAGARRRMGSQPDRRLAPALSWRDGDLFSVAALGIPPGTLATTMGQLACSHPRLRRDSLSGATTPMESMPVWLQWIMQIFSPTPHFTPSAGVLSRRWLDVMFLPEIAKIATARPGFRLAKCSHASERPAFA